MVLPEPSGRRELKADDAEILAASNSGYGVPPLLGSIPPASSSKVYDTSTRPEEPQGGPAARTRKDRGTSRNPQRAHRLETVIVERA
ncbi:hypothetical protein [Streptomyces sp. NPDC001604]|uniref:hypothetical protein n=1 Tax=Streptomyces sp. NPDC001604 TaxID=3364593 RepID=UPI00369636BE